MAGGRFLSGDDPTISPDARVRATVGVGNDCEPYVDPLIGLAYPIAPPGVQLPSCFAVDTTRGQPGVQPILDRIYAGASAQIKADAIGELERLAIDVFLARQRAQMSYTPTELAFFAEQQRRIDAGLPIITADQLAALSIRPALGPGPVDSGGRMTASLLGVGVGAPGGSLPLSFLPTVPTFATMGPTQQASFDPFGGSLLGTLGGAAISLGSQYLAQQLAAKQAEDAFKRQRDLLLLQAQLGFAPAQQPTVVVGANGQLQVGGMTMQGGLSLTENPPVQGPIWPTMPGNGACCPRGPVTLSPMDAPALYKQGCGPCGTISPRARFFALRANGTRDLFVRVGTVNSVSPRTLTKFARRWAKQAKLTVGSRGGRRGRRRPR